MVHKTSVNHLKLEALVKSDKVLVTLKKGKHAKLKKPKLRGTSTSDTELLCELTKELTVRIGSLQVDDLNFFESFFVL